MSDRSRSLRTTITSRDTLNSVAFATEHRSGPLKIVIGPNNLTCPFSLVPHPSHPRHQKTTLTTLLNMSVPTASKLSEIYTEEAFQKQKGRWQDLLAKFKSQYGQDAQFVSRSPGRVNLIGEVSFLENLQICSCGDHEKGKKQELGKFVFGRITVREPAREVISRFSARYEIELWIE